MTRHERDDDKRERRQRQGSLRERQKSHGEEIYAMDRLNSVMHDASSFAHKGGKYPARHT